MVEKNKYSFVVDFFSGGLAGVIAKTISAPIERVKILLQTQRENNKIINKYNGIIDCFGRCVRDEGILSLWRGNGVNVIRYFPTQALNFSFKDFYGRYFNVRKCQDSQMHFLWMNIWCGGLAGSTTTLFVHPLDFVRTRLAVDMGKLKNERQFTSLKDCLQKSVGSDGIRGIYRGLVVAVSSIFFYRGLYFGIYDTGKDKLFNPDCKLWMKFFWAQASVIIAELLSYPGDTVKRKLMMQSRKETKDYNGMTDCFQKVYKTEGIQGLWRGSFSNILRGVGSSLCLILYDEIKKVFTENSQTSQN